ncbi:MAG: bifunctional adenosylcobinamide kinase/adenosylcobinamide-phosphate guanylyltransferase [Clostridium sp.]|nr:bifunctional adenosylcobinamide kinase/adenosylcobinamide-phosphate guanylyltransferase [Acetatifactor muris]MCM1527231.1 bifunctional adenosylcobinamide kinase/adenosylcobinamide-phosphate guanylyltransferase [Bacteroides sp.]MCM1563074.1 bifunctional adenosylcobinamide kinase/adenosylcobinamide-phosphate guanylyltransferase [Clostridium sp.]
MKLVIGGIAQGKLEYVLQKYAVSKERVWSGALPDRAERSDRNKGTVVLYKFQDWVKARIACGGCPEEEILRFLDECKDCIIISDEIGNGIVPTDPVERAYRERTGRILVQLAGRAEEVERVICGIAQRIK